MVTVLLHEEHLLFTRQVEMDVEMPLDHEKMRSKSPNEEGKVEI